MRGTFHRSVTLIFAWTTDLDCFLNQKAILEFFKVKIVLYVIDLFAALADSTGLFKTHFDQGFGV